VLVTIVTPALDAARFLPDCLRSIAAQTHPRALVQHVLADGGSTDDTAALARAAGAEVDVARDRSLYDALNRAVRLARGEAIGWLNADDTYAPDAIARVAAIFEARPEVEIVVGDYVMSSARGRIVRRTGADVLERIRRGERRGTWVSPLAVFFRTSTLRALGEWLPGYRASSDLDLWIRAAARMPPPVVAHAGAILGNFRVHAASISTGASPERSLRETLEIARRWRSDPTAPPGVRRFALYVERNYGFMLRIWEIRDRSRVEKLRVALSYWREQRRLGDGTLGDMVVRFV
jgi:glycosyltransferase involved in cell wall biosynthesis